jgi:hypothetical protein
MRLHEIEIFANLKQAEMPSVKTLIQTMEKIATILKEKDL